MQYFHEKSQKFKLHHADFVTTMDKAKKGDVVYCDPPYVPLTQTSNFTQYHPEGFGESQQLQLVEKAKTLQNRGITVIISNHDTPFVRTHYTSATLHRILVSRHINCDTTKRNPVVEVIAVFSPKKK